LLIKYGREKTITAFSLLCFVCWPVASIFKPK
jgi:hypothetical protein